MDIERSIDGMFGRVLSWLTQAPVRSPVREAMPAEPITPVSEVAKPVAKSPAAKQPAAKQPAAKKPAAKKQVTKKPAAKKPATKKPATKKPAARKPAARKAAAKRPAAPVADLDRFVEGVGRTTGGGDDLETRILAALAESAEGATLAELQSATGGQLAAVRRTLNQLLKAGRIHRGKGIGTRYRLE